MASPITSTGIGSGLKITEMVTALADAEKAAKQKQITTQSTKNTASLTAVGQLQGALAAFTSTLKTLGSTTAPAFNGFAATSSDEKGVKATAGSSAVAGTYSIVVQELATASKVTTAALTPAQASAIPSGELTISQNGIDTKVNITATTSLEEVRNQINTTMQGKGISANIVNDASGSRLVFTSTTTGAGTDISVKGDSAMGTLLDIDGTQKMSDSATGAGAITAVAGDAKFTVDGLALTSSKNSVSNAISGLTLELVGKNQPSTITVASNTEGLQASMQSFVDSFNTLVKLVSTLTKGTTSSNGTFVAAPMTGDSAPRSILEAVRKEIASATATSGLGSLSQLGIATQQADGTLSFDTTKFKEAVTDKQLGGQMQAFFTGDDNNKGFISRIEDSLKPFTAANGVLAQKKTSLDKITVRLEADQEALDRRIETLTASLTKKYNAMDLVVAQLKATGESITSIFEAMNAQKNAS
ncbi:flagellar filament capping protein FliD [Pseudomonas sp. LJDD11]|uniref:flagellar filament capping protein FliD n=1 Tax=Pseudomonas sp. LJDD11 TaxID=2931984 RepID=UPI00211CA85E|nr:flagellar filament capping protein FliD [Pseudomonas sp. LJDD11]MCQ9424913.1 flagellar filament capping protein FliD [Pseudomonas sp. LJDD11]